MTTILTKPAVLGETELAGQVLVLDIDGYQLGSPTKTKPWWKVNIQGVLPDAPKGVTALDVRWLQQATYYVVAVFPVGTYDVSEYETPDA